MNRRGLLPLTSWRQVCFLLGFLLLPLSSSLAESSLAGNSLADKLSRPLTLQECVQLAEQSPPFVYAQRARQLEAQAQVTQSQTLPNPVASYVAQDIGLQTADRSQLLHQVTLGFPPLLALLKLQESRAACTARERTEAALAEERRQLKLAVGRAYYQLLLAEQLVAVDERALIVAAALVAQNRQREILGEAGGVDVQRAQAELLDLQRSTEISRRQLTLQQLALSILLGAESPQAVRLQAEESALLEQTPFLIAELLPVAQQRRPDLRQNRAERKQAEEQKRLAQLRTIPFVDLQVAAGARLSQLGVGGIVSLSAALPLLDWNSGPRQRAMAQVLAAQAAQLRVERQVRLEIESFQLEWQQARETLRRRVRPLLEVRRQVLTATQKQFAVGMVSLLEVIAAQRDLLQAERAAAQAEHDVLWARWQLAVATGS